MAIAALKARSGKCVPAIGITLAGRQAVARIVEPIARAIIIALGHTCAFISYNIGCAHSLDYRGGFVMAASTPLLFADGRQTSVIHTIFKVVLCANIRIVHAIIAAQWAVAGVAGCCGR
jgi:hypothetical protein